MFRTKYLDYAELTAQLDSWARQHAGLVRVTSLEKSAEGRDIPLVTIGRNPDQARPAIWIDGNMHATELCGSSVALAIAEDVLNIHLGSRRSLPSSDSIGGGNDEGSASLPPHMADAIKDALFYVVPRISPDGAEAVL